MARTKVDTDLGVEELRPQASVVDSYVDPGPSNLRGVAESLSSLSGSLRSVLGKRDKDKEEEDKLRGEAAFYENNADGFAEGVRTGVVPAHESKAFVEGFKETEGHVAGGDMRMKFRDAFDAWEGKNNASEEEYQEFFKGFIKENIGTKDPAVLRGLLPQVRSLMTEGQALFTDYASQKTYNDSLTAHGAAISQGIDGAVLEGASDPDGTDYGTINTQIAAWREEFLSTGGKEADADKMVVDTVTAKALQLRDRELLDTLLVKVPGKDFTYADTDYGRDKREATIEAIEVIKRRDATEKTQAYNHERSVEGDKARSEATQMIAKDPLGPLPEDLMARGRKYDDTWDNKVKEWRQSAAQGISDDAKLKEVRQAIIEGGGTAAIIEAMDSGALTRASDIDSAFAFERSIRENQKSVEEMRSDSAYKTVLENISIATQGRDDLMQPIKGESMSGMAARYDFEMAMIQWATQNPDATIFERQEAIGKISKAIFDRVRPGDGLTEGGTYERPPATSPEMEAATPNPYANPPKPGSPAAEGAVATEEDADAKGEVGTDPGTTEGITPEEAEEDADTFLNGLDENQRAIIKGEADQKGLTEKEYAKTLLATPEAGSTGTAKMMNNPFTGMAERALELAQGKPNGNITVDKAQEMLEQALNVDLGDMPEVTVREGSGIPLEAARLAALTRQHEAGGNYNAVYGNAGSKRDLSKYTLDEILGMQVVARRRGKPSTAIGGYQFIYKTLKGLKEELGYTGKEQFTPDLQDEMFMALLKRRGWDRFRAGTLSKRGFALRLSQEWASLPDPRTGRSYYAGDGLNASRVPASQVYAALGFS